MRRLSLILLFVLVGGSLLAGAHLYLAKRLILEPGVGEPWRGALLGLLVCLGAGASAAGEIERVPLEIRIDTPEDGMRREGPTALIEVAGWAGAYRY